jgi:hypothetical protein
VQVEDILNLKPDRLRKGVEGINLVVFRVGSHRRFFPPSLCR